MTWRNRSDPDYVAAHAFERTIDALSRNRLAKEHDVGLENAATPRTVGHDEAAVIGILDVHIAVGSNASPDRRPGRIGLE